MGEEFTGGRIMHQGKYRDLHPYVTHRLFELWCEQLDKDIPEEVSEDQEEE